MVGTGYLTHGQLEAMPVGARVVDEDGDVLVRRPDGQWQVVSVPDSADPTVGDVWPTWVLRARRSVTRR